MTPAAWFALDGRAAIVTGGGSGIGRACALALAGAGAAVLVVGRRQVKLDAVCAEVRAAGGVCEAFAADLTEEEGCRAMVEACRGHFGRVDILVNSAGSRGASGELEAELTAENLRATMAADFDATFFAVKHAWPACAEHRAGSIINIASLAALQARGPVVYAAAKGAVRSFSRTMAKRLGPHGVRVNTIYPGFVVTEMTQGALDDPALKARFVAESPLGRIGRAEDIAACALYLAGDAARFVTGQDFVIDGGATC